MRPDFTRANLTGAIVERAGLLSTVFRFADLTRADFLGANSNLAVDADHAIFDHTRCADGSLATAPAACDFSG